VTYLVSKGYLTKNSTSHFTIFNTVPVDEPESQIANFDDDEDDSLGKEDDEDLSLSRMTTGIGAD